MLERLIIGAARLLADLAEPEHPYGRRPPTAKEALPPDADGGEHEGYNRAAKAHAISDLLRLHGHRDYALPEVAIQCAAQDLGWPEGASPETVGAVRGNLAYRAARQQNTRTAR